MQKIIEDLESIECPHQLFKLFPKDVFVEERPNHTQVIHNCERLSIFQDIRGIRRYFLKNGSSSEPKAESPDNFLEGLMGGEEQDTSREAIEERLGPGDGEAELPF